jgi:hypothetical protein
VLHGSTALPVTNGGLLCCRASLLDASVSMDAVEHGDADLQARRRLLMHRGFALKPEEEVLVEELLNEPAQPSVAVDPFNPHMYRAADDSSRKTDAWAQLADKETDQANVPESLAEIDTKLMDLALDHDWTEMRSLADYGLPAHSSVASLTSRAAATTHRLSCGLSSAPGLLPSARTPPTGVPQEMSTQGRHTQILDTITEQNAMSSQPGSVRSTIRLHPPGSTSASVGSRHDGADYLRPMREQRELETLCAPPDRMLG